MTDAPQEKPRLSKGEFEARQRQQTIARYCEADQKQLSVILGLPWNKQRFLGRFIELAHDDFTLKIKAFKTKCRVDIIQYENIGKIMGNKKRDSLCPMMECPMTKGMRHHTKTCPVDRRIPTPMNQNKKRLIGGSNKIGISVKYHHQGDTPKPAALSSTIFCAK